MLLGLAAVLLVVLLDLAVAGGLIFALVAIARRLRPGRRVRPGARLSVLPAGTFTAIGLPADANDPAGDGKPHPADGHGTWQITRGDGVWYVLFILSSGSQFRLDAGNFASPGGASIAMFSYVFARYNAVDLWAFHRR